MKYFLNFSRLYLEQGIIGEHFVLLQQATVIEGGHKLWILKPLMFVIRKIRMCKEDSFKTLVLQNNNKQLLKISIGQCQH